MSPTSRSRGRVRCADERLGRARAGGAPDILVKLARCCTPVPGDEIVGFVTRGSGVSVHQAKCHNVQSLLREPDRMIEVEWAPSSKSLFLVQIQIERSTAPGCCRMSRGC